MWEEVVKKTGNAEIKADLQAPSYIWEINSKCPKGHCLLAKKDKKDTQREYRNKAFKDREKVKSYNPSSTN